MLQIQAVESHVSEAVADHQPVPDDPRLLREWPYFAVPRLSFNVGQIPGQGSGQAGRSEMNLIEGWVLERVDDQHFKVIQGWSEYGQFILDISRPSVGTDIVWVHSGSKVAPVAGYGMTTIWKRQPDGSWIDTGEIVSRWIS